MRDFKEIYYRPHKAFLAEQCPSSLLRNPKFIPKQQVGVPAHLGTACGYAFEHFIVPRQAIEDENIIEIAKMHNVEVDGYNGLKWRVYKLQNAYAKVLEKGYFRTPIAEEEWQIALKNGYQYRCFADLYEIHAPWGVVLELKMGKVDTGWEYQARDYAMAMIKKFQDLKLTHVYSIVFAPIVDYYNVTKFTIEELLALEDKLLSTMGKVGEQYVTGDGCEYCDNLLSCPGIKRQIDPVSKDIMAAGGIQKISGDDIRKWRATIKGMKKICDTYDSAEKLILGREGSVDLGNGKELYLRDQYTKEVDAGKAISVLVDDFKVERQDFISKLDITNKNIEILSDSIAPSNGKTKMRKAVWDLLEEKGAMKKVLSHVKATRPIPKDKLAQPKTTEKE